MAVPRDLVRRGIHRAVCVGSTELEMMMTKQEIDEMMRDLPSQRGWREETTTEKVLGGLAFVLCVLILCFI